MWGRDGAATDRELEHLRPLHSRQLALDFFMDRRELLQETQRKLPLERECEDDFLDRVMITYRDKQSLPRKFAF
ncbi:hypothetical protein ATO4_26599 [Aurantimonas sp. 22II-16-19i]|nr:hypothetical protein ATO4_26599 [Aurantimonas sp. 22II-16-19i]